MAALRTPREVFLELVSGVAEGRWQTLPELYAEQTHVVHPFAPLGGDAITSRAELREHFAPPEGAPPLPKRTVENVTIHETADPEVIVAEFEYHGDAIGTGERVIIPGIFVLRVHDGEIVSSRDYLDHLASARFRGQLGEVLDAVREHG
ncbi:MAG: nuclear transport factor 2 family protein [Pseudolysinimonas sp.]